MKTLTVYLTLQECETVCDALADKLSQDGIGPDGEVNDHGKMLDDLIDKFNPYTLGEKNDE